MKTNVVVELFVVLFVSVLGTILCSAQTQQQPAFTPYVINQQEHNTLMTALGEIPAKHALPIMQYLAQLEQQARAKMKSDAEQKPDK